MRFPSLLCQFYLPFFFPCSSTTSPRRLLAFGLIFMSRRRGRAYARRFYQYFCAPMLIDYGAVYSHCFPAGCRASSLIIFSLLPLLYVLILRWALWWCWCRCRCRGDYFDEPPDWCAAADAMSYFLPLVVLIWCLQPILFANIFTSTFAFTTLFRLSCMRLLRHFYTITVIPLSPFYLTGFFLLFPAFYYMPACSFPFPSPSSAVSLFIDITPDWLIFPR